MCIRDRNYVIASEHGRPWHKQINLLLAYLAFYNPITCLSKIPPVVKTALEFKNKLDEGRPWQNRLKVSPEFLELSNQIVGFIGLVKTARRTLGWAARLAVGTIVRYENPPSSCHKIQQVASPAAETGLITESGVLAKIRTRIGR